MLAYSLDTHMLTDVCVQKYEDKASKDKDRYNKEMSNYVAPDDEGSSSEDDGPKKKKKKKAKKDPNRPKRSMSSFMFFANAKRQEVRAKHPDLKVTEIGKKLSDLWKALTPDEKKVCDFSQSCSAPHFAVVEIRGYGC